MAMRSSQVHQDLYMALEFLKIFDILLIFVFLSLALNIEGKGFNEYFIMLLLLSHCTHKNIQDLKKVLHKFIVC